MQRCVKNEATLGYKMPKMHQACFALRDAHCGKLSKQEASRSSCFHCHLCHKRCQSTPPRRATCGCTGGRARGNLRPWAGASLFCAATVSLLMYVPSTGVKCFFFVATPERSKLPSGETVSSHSTAWKQSADLEEHCASWCYFRRSKLILEGCSAQSSEHRSQVSSTARHEVKLYSCLLAGWYKWPRPTGSIKEVQQKLHGIRTPCHWECG